MSDGRARALLGLPVCSDGVRIGTVGAVWIDAADGVLGIELTGSRNGTSRYLPFAAARLGDLAVHTSSLAVLGAGPTTFFEEHGARRVSATQPVGLGRVAAG